MKIIDAPAIDRLLTYPDLIEALANAFRGGIEAPPRHHHMIPQPSGADAKLLLMPAWTVGTDERLLGTKIVSVFPENVRIGKPSVYGSYLLQSGDTGEPQAVLDGTALTAWRTAGTSALAARHLARPDAAHLLMVGAGALAPHLIRAHRAVRPVTKVTIWNRGRSRAIQTAFALGAAGINVEIADDLERAVKQADIVSCATLSGEPLIAGKWLRKGTHLDLVGAFTPAMREADDDAVGRAQVYVDSRAGAGQSGDIALPLRSGALAKDGIRGDLFDLCRGARKGRTRKTDITLFKSVGLAIEDLAAAMLVWRRLRDEPTIGLSGEGG